MRNKRNAKQGIASELVIVIPVATILAFLVSWLLISLFIDAPKEKRDVIIGESLEKLKLEHTLGVFLKSPVSSDHAATMEELLAWSYLTGNEEELEGKAMPLLNKLLEANERGRGWSLSVEAYARSGKRLMAMDTIGKERPGDLAQHAGAVVPLMQHAKALVPLPWHKDGRYLVVTLTKTGSSAGVMLS